MLETFSNIVKVKELQPAEYAGLSAGPTSVYFATSHVLTLGHLRALVYQAFFGGALGAFLLLCGVMIVNTALAMTSLGLIGLLFDRRKQQRVQFWILLLDLPGECVVIRRGAPASPPDEERPAARGDDPAGTGRGSRRSPA